MNDSLLDLGIVLLNWNGIDDTIACLESLYAESSLPRWVLLADNGSKDGSPARAVDWILSQTVLGAREIDSVSPGVREFMLESVAGKPRFVLMENGANFGFAIGNNRGLRWLLERDPKYVMLLNNDTELRPGALGELLRGMESLPAAQAMVPQIRYWRRPDIIWNCGGTWSWIGRPKYAFADQPATLLDGRPPFPVGFVTGCALLIRSSWLRANGLLTERFFFGEEDVNLSWRMRATAADAMWCWPSAIIFHKVGASVERAAERALIPRMYLHYLNRLIFLRSVHGRGLAWQVQRFAVMAYLLRSLVTRFDLSLRESLALLRMLAQESRDRDGVDAEHFAKVMRSKFPAVP